MKNECVSVGKSELDCMNEDAVVARDGMIAVSDGAGGGGLFAERWSRYLLKRLPGKAIDSVTALDHWIGTIWEPFYDKCEKDASRLGGMSLEKFYDEGSFATLVAVWRTKPGICSWISFGDSVAFHYNPSSGILEHSFGKLGDFDEPPYLINCKDELAKDGFRSGTFCTGRDSVVFAASDALAHYVMMMYELSRAKEYAVELEDAVSRHTKNGNYIHAAQSIGNINFETDVLRKLFETVGDQNLFSNHLRLLKDQGLLAHDDYSLAVMWPAPRQTEPCPIPSRVLRRITLRNCACRPGGGLRPARSSARSGRRRRCR